MAYWSYEWWDLSLEDLTLHCPAELKAGVVPYFDWRHWRLFDLADIAEDLPEIIKELEHFQEEFDVMMEKVNEALEKAEEIAKDNPEEVRFILVQMDWDTETTYENSWITQDTDATQTWISWEPNGIVEIYVGDWYVTVRSSENESWIVRLRMSKAKDGAYLNHL